jgi:hypothetical protein
VNNINVSKHNINYAYHVVDKTFHDDIKQNGLQPEKYTNKKLYLSNDPKLAQKQSSKPDDVNNTNTYRIKHKNLPETNIDPNDFDRIHDMNEYHTDHPIPPEHIEHWNGNNWEYLSPHSN